MVYILSGVIYSVKFRAPKSVWSVHRTHHYPNSEFLQRDSNNIPHCLRWDRPRVRVLALGTENRVFEIQIAVLEIDSWTRRIAARHSAPCGFPMRGHSRRWCLAMSHNIQGSYKGQCRLRTSVFLKFRTLYSSRRMNNTWELLSEVRCIRTVGT